MAANKITTHFQQADPVIYRILIEMKIKPLKISSRPAGYLSKLCEDILSQQLAGKAASAIIGRFHLLFNRQPVTPAKILSFPQQSLRDIGISWAKVSYIRDLAQKLQDNKVNLKNLHRLNDLQVIEELVKVKGIGSWTAEMFLIFTLGRENVFSYGDFGLKKALQQLYKFNRPLTAKQTDRIINPWSPYKSYGCLALWRHLDL